MTPRVVLLSMRPRRLGPVLVLLLALVLAACGGEEDGGGAAASSAPRGEGGWQAVLDEARGQTVSWWMYGGDDRINAYVREHVKPAAQEAGIELRVVPITDTADAVQRVVAQRRAGKDSGGAVDLIWINGENFASGKAAGLWLDDWARELPNARYVDFEDPSIATDFQVPVEGQESPWSRAAFVFAADTKRLPDPPADLDGLLAYARENPGRLTYPAPPDFTGSAFVRQVVQAKGADGAFAYLAELKPFLYREGEVFPKSEAELNELFANGEVDITMSYDSSFVASGVRKGQFAQGTRPFLLGGGALTNVSYVTIPADAAHVAGAKVLADVLLDPELQAIKADPDVLGAPTVLEQDLLPAAAGERFEAVGRSPYLLEDFGEPVQELPADQVAPLEARWKREILR